MSAALSAALIAAPAAALAKDKPAASKDTGKDKKDAKAAESATTDTSKKDKKSGKADKADSDKADKPEKDGGNGKPEQLGTYGEWGAYLAQSGKDKTCYALGQPKDRQPKAKLKDTAGYIFISSRPGDGVRNEVAINLGYATKDGSAATAEIDGDGWELITKGQNAWVKEQSKEREFVGALRGGSKLVVKAASAKGTATVDTYALKGLSDALARVAQECK
ncbi:invasion associated locus B family protein [Methylocystis echinoides]|uniref:invasion associated locus B family protein n=1 Tax=Methylocystis echinoides TaxID=29468 RepID=UPI00249247C4|nr:invasion associated locus B family protein [Methylocystis echinoides]